MNFKSFASPRDEEEKENEHNVLDIFDFYPPNYESKPKQEPANINIMNGSANSANSNKNKKEKISEKKWDPYHVKIKSFNFICLIKRTISF